MCFHPSEKRLSKFAALSGGVLAVAIAGGFRTAHANMRTPKAAGLTSAASGAYESTNWSGYADTASSGYAFNSVSATWTQPAVTTQSSSSYVAASFWVGLDGFNSSTVEQTGTQAVIGSGGTVSYTAWYELYPQVEMPVFTVSPGDKISASVVYQPSSNEYAFNIQDITSGASYQITTINSQTASAARSSAEWIVESPEFGTSSGSYQLATLPDYGSFGFNNASASITGSHVNQTGSISGVTANNAASLNSITLVDGKTFQALSTPAALTGNGGAFSTNYTPEPESFALLGGAAAALLPLKRRKTSGSGRQVL